MARSPLWTPQGKILSPSFYRSDDPIAIAQSLLGKVLCTLIDRQLTCGMITETEAYGGVSDRASHSYGGRRTQRNEPMYHEGGIAYVYLCYGIHHLFNVVTGPKGTPTAVLIRSLAPLDGVEVMLRRRRKKEVHPSLTAGPGSLSQALGITTRFSGIQLSAPPIWIEDRGIGIPSVQIAAGPRIGVAYAGEDAQLPWRFFIHGHPYVSRPNRLK